MSLSDKISRKSENFLRFYRRYKRNRAAMLGLFITALLTILALFAGMITPYPPSKIRVGEPFEPPNSDHLMGTDDLGRDIASGVIYGIRTALLIGVGTASISAIIGILVGVTSGFYGGKVDDLIMRAVDVFMAIPRFFLLLIIAAIMGISIQNIIIVMAFLSWPMNVRLIRAEVLSVKERPYVEAARAMGAGSAALMFREILPNSSAPLIINTFLEIGKAILLEASMSFLGLGDPVVPSLGKMLYNAQAFFYSSWWMAVFPGLAILFTVLGLNLIGDGLNDALNPRILVT